MCCFSVTDNNDVALRAPPYAAKAKRLTPKCRPRSSLVARSSSYLASAFTAQFFERRCQPSEFERRSSQRDGSEKIRQSRPSCSESPGTGSAAPRAKRRRVASTRTGTGLHDGRRPFNSTGFASLVDPLSWSINGSYLMLRVLRRQQAASWAPLATLFESSVRQRAVAACTVRACA